MMRKLFIFLPALVIFETVLAGCATPVSQIARDPSVYRGRTVRVRGTAGRSLSIPLSKITVFLLEGEKTKVPVVARQRPVPGRSLVVRGTLWAFPKDGMNATAAKALEAMENFLVQKLRMNRERAQKIAPPVLAAVRKMSKGLGRIWFIIEEN